MLTTVSALPVSGSLKVLYFATQGAGSGDERRISYLLEPLAPRLLNFERSRKATLPLRLWKELRRQRPDVIVLEGTGVFGGLAVIAARLLSGVPYVVSSGDAVSAYLRALHPWAWPVAALYERALYRLSAGFIGWSPYLVGRALHMGASRGMTAAHYASATDTPSARELLRTRLGIPAHAIVIGIVGSVVRNRRRGYSYGVDLVRAVRKTDRADLRVLIVGGGSGLSALRELAGPELGRRVLLPGSCPPSEVGNYLSAMDVGALSQSTDLVGSTRYTTKLSDYLVAGLPVIAGGIPAAYDLDTGWLWRLAGEAPWDEVQIESLATFMRDITREEIESKAACVPRDLEVFDARSQQRRVCAFVAEVTARAVSLRGDTGRGPVDRTQASLTHIGPV